MNAQERRSLSSSMRALLLTAAGTLGLMALGATTAAAAEAPAGPGLLDSLTATVDSTGVPAALPSLTDPQLVAGAPASDPHSVLQDVPELPDLVARIPDVASAPVGIVLEPVTTLADGVVAEVPIVRSVVPAGTVTGVTAPVVGVVDSAVGGVTAPVLEVAAPLPEPGMPAPVVPSPVAPVPVPGPVLPSGAVEALPESDQVAVVPRPATSEDVIAAPDSGTPAVVEGVRASTTGPTVAMSGETSPTGPAVAGPPDAASQDDFPAMGATPPLAQLVPAVGEIPVLPGIPSTSAGVTSSMTGGGAAAPLAVLSGSAFLALPVLGRLGRGSTSSSLPAGPSFEPGSSPD